jgi:hypothetical protein
MTNSDDIQAAAKLLLFGQLVKMASTVPALRTLHTSPHLSLSPLPHQPPAPRPDAHRPTFRPKTTICEWPWRGCGQAAGAVCVKSSSPAGSAVPAAPAAPAVLVVLCPMATGTALPSDGMSTTRASSTLRLAVASPSSSLVLGGSSWPRPRAG